jgi:hypothetical protein
LVGWLKSKDSLGGGPIVFHLALGLNGDYFYPLGADFYHRPFAEDKAQKWREATIQWIGKTFVTGDLLAELQSGDVDSSPRVPPRIHLWLPETTFCRAKFKLSRDHWVDIINSYGQSLTGLGGIIKYRNIKPNDQQIASYYRATKGNDESSEPSKEELARLIQVPEFMKDRSNGHLERYVNESISLSLNNAKDLLETFDFNCRAAQIESERIKFAIYNERKVLARMEKNLARYRQWAEPLMGLEPAEVLIVLYRAKLMKDHSGRTPREHSTWPAVERSLTVSQGVYLLNNGVQIEVDDYEWRDLDQAVSGVGVFSLIAHLSGYDEEQTIIYLLGHFSYEETRSSLGYHTARKAKLELTTMLKTPFELPDTTAATWPTIRNYLMNEFRLPDKVVEEARSARRILTTSLNTLIFNCDQDSGMFFMFRQKIDPQNADQLPHVEHPLAESLPWNLAGPGEPIYLTDHPLEALSLKALHPDCPVLAIGERSQLDSVRPYLVGKAAVVTVRPKKPGHRLSRSLKLLNLPIVKVPKGRTWNEFWRLNL